MTPDTDLHAGPVPGDSGGEGNDVGRATEARIDELDPGRKSSDAGVVDQAKALFDAALATFQSSLELFKAEFRLAKSSASTLLMMMAVAAVLAISMWLALLALVAAGVYELTGNWFLGIGVVVLLAAAGIAWSVVVIKRCLRDMAMPRTRRMLSGQSAEPSSEGSP